MAFLQLKTRLRALLLLLVAAMAVIAYLAARRLEASTAVMDSVINDRVVCLQQLHAVSESYGERVPETFERASRRTVSPPEARALLASARDRGSQQWQAYRRTYLTEEEARLVARADVLLKDAERVTDRGEALLAQGTPQALEAFTDRDLPQAIQPLIAVLDELVALQVDVSREQALVDRAAHSRTVGLLGLLSVVAVALGSFLTWSALRRYAAETSAHEERLNRLNSFYAALSRTNQLIVREPDEAALLAEIVNICIDAGHAHMACIHVLDGKTVHRVAVAGKSLAFYDNLPTSWDIAAPDTMNTLASKVLREGVRAVRQDYQAEVESNRWRDRTLQHGIRSAATFPIRRAGRIYGAFSLYASEVGFFEPQLLALGDEIATDLSFALDNIDRRAALASAASARESQVAADAANRAKTAFLSKMSHELRTPLNAMLGFTRLIERDARSRLLPADIARLDQIRSAGWHLLSLVNDVLDVSSIESGRFDVQLRSLPLAPLLEETIRIAEQQARQSGITLDAAYDQDEPASVFADPVRLRQVLINLLSNAAKYNRPGGKVAVNVEVQAETVDVEVADNGLGMSPEQLAHLYEPFNRLGRERGGIEGTGLGLALTRQLVQLMGGELAFQSKVGVGTRATLTLRKAGRVDDDMAAAGSFSETYVDTSLSGTVLYIEDNEINILVVEQMLAEWPQVRFMHAPDGVIGIAMAKALQPTLTLLDMNLPDMTGLEVLRQLRADPATLHLKVVMLSASAMAGDISNALDAGAQDYWTKPLDFERFLEGVGTLLAEANRHSNTASI